MTRSLHRNIKAVRVIRGLPWRHRRPAAPSARSSTTTASRPGFDVNIGWITATNATVTAKVFEGDATGAPSPTAPAPTSSAHS